MLYEELMERVKSLKRLRRSDGEAPEFLEKRCDLYADVLRDFRDAAVPPWMSVFAELALEVEPDEG